MKNVDLNEYRAQKEGSVTVKGLLAGVYERSDEFKDVVIIVLDHEGCVNIGHSDMDSSLKLLGLVEAGKDQILDKFKG